MFLEDGKAFLRFPLVDRMTEAHLVEAIAERSATLNSEQMARLAAVFARRPDDDGDRGRPFDADAICAVQGLVEDWGKRMLAADDAKRWHKAKIATLHYFGGLSAEETAAALELSLSTVERDWRFTRAWLGRRLGEKDESNDG